MGLTQVGKLAQNLYEIMLPIRFGYVRHCKMIVDKWEVLNNMAFFLIIVRVGYFNDL